MDSQSEKCGGKREVIWYFVPTEVSKGRGNYGPQKNETQDKRGVHADEIETAVPAQ